VIALDFVGEAKSHAVCLKTQRYAVDLGTIETLTHLSQGSPEPITGTESLFPSATEPDSKIPKDALRTSLRASTIDGVFATIFSNIVGGVLLSNFLVELHASPVEIGLSASIPMVANLIQPLGAYWSDRTRSRHMYCYWIYTPARLIWLLLVAGIAIASWKHLDSHLLVQWTLLIVCATHLLGALGSAAWLSWLAVLVPRRLRGRYFGIRNSAASLTCLIAVPIAGVIVSVYPRGTIEGYGFVVFLGIIAGLVSLNYQWFMVDVDPQEQKAAAKVTDEKLVSAANPQPVTSRINSIATLPILQDGNFLRFLLYFGVWMFAVNLSAPFFNLYMLDNLAIDVTWVTLYNSLTAGANLLMLIFWGKLVDRVGNRSLLLLVGILVAVTPLLWLGTGANTLSLWLWLPLLHILSGGTWAAIDLCNNNIQLGIAPVKHQASYFAVAAAIAGVSGALGTTAGGYLAQFTNYGGLPGMFALSSVVRLVALLPLVFVHEAPGYSIRQVIKALLPSKTQPVNLQLSEEP